MSALITATLRRHTDATIAVLGLAGLAGALALRVQAAGAAGSQSILGGLVFGIVLCVLAGCIGLLRPSLDIRAVGFGIAGAAVLCLPPLLAKLAAGTGPPAAPSVAWAGVVSLVAVAEELLLRGALYERLQRWRGQTMAIVLTAVAFGLIHVPVYGWHVLILDLAVGVWLGTLRALSRSVTAPAVAHALADLAGWWLQ
jgi:membrane protease YdiL (CAAX protease family)